MRKRYLLIGAAVVVFVAGGIFLFQGKNPPPKTVRKPAVAGAFYPGNREELSEQIDQLLASTRTRQKLSHLGGPRILIVPHAGYQFSGQVAAYAFSEIKDREYSTVVLIGNSHHYAFNGGAVYTKGFFETPLGQVPIDEELAQKLVGENPLIFAGPQYHEKEHSLEVEIPFLQKALKDFQIVPIILGDRTTATAKVLAEALAEHLDSYTLIVISSDLSHYPNYEDAQKSDQQVIESILKNDLEKFSDLVEKLPQAGIPNLQTAACGAGAIKTALILSENLKITDIQLLKYANSGNVLAGDKNRVVGYAAICFYGERFGDELSREERQELLKISRQTLNTHITTNQIPGVEIEHNFLDTPLGAFVTLHKNGILRGCIGTFEPEKPLWQVVQEMTVAAATQDRRFTPVGSEELDEIEIEISVLSKRRRIFDPQNIEMGGHGVSLIKGGRHGVFLPQVATENNWDLDQFMGQLCTQKMGLSWDCWQKKDTEIYVFTAQIFAEEEVAPR